METLKGKKILIFQQRNWAKSIGHFLAAKLQGEGCRLAAVTFKKSTHEFILAQKEVKYDLVISDDSVMDDPKGYLAGEQISLEEICGALGVDSVWPLIHSIRNFVKSYRQKYFYGYKKNVSDEVMTDYVKAVYKYMRLVFSQFKPDVIIAPIFVVCPFIMFNYYAAKKGIKMFAVTDSKIKGYYIFTYTHLDDKGSFYERVDNLNKGSVSENRDRARKYINEFRQSFKNPDYSEAVFKKRTLLQKVRHQFAPFYHILMWYLNRPKNHIKSTGITPDFRPPCIILRDHYCRDRYIKFMERFPYFPFDRLGKFVYFPLQFQPEANIDAVAPFFSNQIEIARLVAMSLPGDYVLAVKEHPAMVGYRPPSYIKKIVGLPNVKLIDYRIANEELLKCADLIISPSSTALAEAAFYCKPAIQLGGLGTTLKLPNVFKHSDMATLSKKIKEVLSLNLKMPDYERRLENYVAAAMDEGFDFRYHKVWSKGIAGENMDDLWLLYKKEIIRALS